MSPLLWIGGALVGLYAVTRKGDKKLTPKLPPREEPEDGPDEEPEDGPDEEPYEVVEIELRTHREHGPLMTEIIRLANGLFFYQYDAWDAPGSVYVSDRTDYPTKKAARTALLREFGY